MNQRPALGQFRMSPTKRLVIAALGLGSKWVTNMKNALVL